MSSPGWYQDPENGGWRFWDGQSWRSDEADATSRPAPDLPPERSLLSRVDHIDLASERSRKVSATIAVAAGIAAILATAAILYTSLVGQIPAAPLLLIPGVSLLAVGQLWSIIILTRRVNDRAKAAGGAKRRWQPKVLRPGDLRGGLPTPVAALFLTLFYGAILLAGGSIWGLARSAQMGTPTDDPNTCEYSSNDHSSYRCLTKSEHERQLAGQQRIVESVFAGLFIAHCGINTGEVFLRRRTLG